MPYIHKKQRHKYRLISKQIDGLIGIDYKGDLEYLIFKLMKKYMESRTYTYTMLHDCVYAAIHAGHEFERRYLDIREDKARRENGDIY